MFSVEPTLARMFFRSGADALVDRRLSLGAEELGLADVGFLPAAAVPEGRGGVAVGLTRLGAAPAGEAAPGAGPLFLAALPEGLWERLRSAAKAGVRQQVPGEIAKGSLEAAGDVGV